MKLTKSFLVIFIFLLSFSCVFALVPSVTLIDPLDDANITIFDNLFTGTNTFNKTVYVDSICISGDGCLTNFSNITSSLSWYSIVDLPSGFDDDVDNDTKYIFDNTYLHNDGSNGIYLNMTDNISLNRNAIHDILELTSKDGFRLTTGDLLQVDTNYTGISNSIVFYHPLDIPEGDVLYSIIQDGKFVRTFQSGLPFSASFMGNSQVIARYDTSEKNGTLISSCQHTADKYNETLKVACNSAEEGADLLVENDIQAFGKIYSDDGFRGEGDHIFAGLGNTDISILNSDLYISNPRIESITVPDTLNLTINVFSDGNIDPWFKVDQVGTDTNNWKVVNDFDFCTINPCATARGGDAGANRTMQLNVTYLKGFENVTYKADFGFEGVTSGSIFKVQGNNQTGSGWEDLIVYDNFTGADLVVSDVLELSDKYNDPDLVTFRLVFNATLPIEKVYFSNVSLHADNLNASDINVTKFDTKILGGDGSGDVFIYYNDSSMTWTFSPSNVTFQDVTQSTLNITDTIILNGTAIDDWSDVNVSYLDLDFTGTIGLSDGIDNDTTYENLSEFNNDLEFVSLTAPSGRQGEMVFVNNGSLDSSEYFTFNTSSGKVKIVASLSAGGSDGVFIVDAGAFSGGLSNGFQIWGGQGDDRLQFWRSTLDEFRISLDDTDLISLRGDNLISGGGVKVENALGINTPPSSTYGLSVGGTYGRGIFTSLDPMLVLSDSNGLDTTLRSNGDEFEIINGVGSVGFRPMTIDLNNNKVTLLNGDFIDEFSNDTTLSDNSNDAVPTEKAVKTYVDNEIMNIDISMYESPKGQLYMSGYQSISNNYSIINMTDTTYITDSAFNKSTDEGIDVLETGFYRISYGVNPIEFSENVVKDFSVGGVVYYDMSNSSSTVIDKFGNTNSTAVTTTFSSDGDGAYADIGTSGYLHNNNIMSSITSDDTFTISAWLKPDDNSPDGFFSEVSGFGVLYAYFDGSGVLRVGRGGSEVKPSTSREITSGVWQMVTVRFTSSSNVDLFVDADYKGSASPSSMPSSTADFNIGNLHDGLLSYDFQGDMDNFGVWDYNLSNTDIELLYNQTRVYEGEEISETVEAPSWANVQCYLSDDTVEIIPSRSNACVGTVMANVTSDSLISLNMMHNSNETLSSGNGWLNIEQIY